MQVEIIDFRDIPIGTLVKYSDHAIKEMGADKKKIGLIVDKDFYEDTNRRVVCWPIIHWEGYPMGHLCHPVNAIPHRKKQAKYAKRITINL